MDRAGSGLCYGPKVRLYVCCTSSFRSLAGHFSYHKHWLHCDGNVSLKLLRQRFGLCWFWDGDSFYCRAGLDLLGPFLQLVPVTGSPGSMGGEGACWLAVLVIPAMLERARVDMGASGEVQGPQTMFRLSSRTTQPTKCFFHAWKAPCFSCILRRAILRPICGEQQEYFLHDFCMFFCTLVCVAFTAPGIMLDGSFKTKISFVGQE